MIKVLDRLKLLLDRRLFDEITSGAARDALRDDRLGLVGHIKTLFFDLLLAEKVSRVASDENCQLPMVVDQGVRSLGVLAKIEQFPGIF